MKCPVCGIYNVCPSCSDWLCDWCGADLMAKDHRPEKSAYQHYGYDHYDDDDGYHD